MTTLKRITKMSYSGLAEEINLAETDKGEEIREKITQARENKNESYLVNGGLTIWTMEWSDKTENVQVHYYKPIGTFESSGDKSLGDFE